MKKYLGQHFLNNTSTLQKIIESSGVKKDDIVIEIGPGHGVLTHALAKKGVNLTSIELDHDLINELATQFASKKNVKIIEGDALHFTPPKTPYHIVANIPYYITSPLINHFLREQPADQRPQSITLLVQKEVAEKICAKPRDLSVLAIQVQLFGTPKIIATIPASHFAPPPKVDSAILHIKINEPPLAEKDIRRFFILVHAGFAHKRKKLIRNLETVLPKGKLQTLFKKMGLSENARAEELNLLEWVEFLA
ncbi:MAG: 16S rRNA (adenine(1518)-N(6)/adenine(1519)-N(6))-dimethyltransferase RsmA [Candidatus Gracilibacteria bacterium]